MSSSPAHDNRPSFMATLGVLPPYTPEDLKQAYFQKVKTAHPDRGGNVADFQKVQDAYQAAQQFLNIRSDRRAWIASQMDHYLAQQALENELRELGAELDVAHTEWLQKSYGEFSELTAAIESIELRNRPVGNQLIDLMAENAGALTSLKQLVVVGCNVTGPHTAKLTRFAALKYLDLSQNQLDKGVVELAEGLPSLETFLIEGSGVGWWSRIKLAGVLKKHQTRVVLPT